MNDFGGSADDLKDALMREYGIDKAKRLVSICCDGASINMGKYTALALIIHCVNLRLKLAIKDAFRED